MTSWIDFEDDAATHIETRMAVLVATVDRGPVDIASVVAHEPGVGLTALAYLLSLPQYLHGTFANGSPIDPMWMGGMLAISIGATHTRHGGRIPPV